MTTAFISHAKADAKKANEIASALEMRAVTCWIAPRDVEPGRNFGDEIIRGIDASRAFLLVLSSASNGSDFVAKELATAVAKKKAVYPIRIEEVEPAPPLALFIAGTHWIDAFNGKLGANADRLAALLAGDPKPGTVPPVRQTPPVPARPRWRRRTAMAVAAAAALLALIMGWPSDRAVVHTAPTVDPVVIDPTLIPEEVPQIAHVPGFSDQPPAAAAESMPEPFAPGETHTLEGEPNPSGF